MPASTEAKRLEQLLEIAGALPEIVITGQRHRKIAVRGKTVAYYVNNEHDDGRIGLIFKVAPGENEALIAEDPERFYWPKYMGHHGWVALRLDLRTIDWAEVTELLTDSYRMVAPKKLASQLD